MTTAVALISGGLDSTLAIKVVQQQGITVEGLNIRTQFECCSLDAQKVSRELGIRLNFVSTGPEYLDLVQNPKHGRGRGLNPCVDCRAFMFVHARKLMETIGADFIVTGEVVGQRPMSQQKKHFAVMERETDLEGRILRPLSAKLLPVTIPEREGLVDREQLHDIRGRSRHELIALAKTFGLEDQDIPSPSTGCALTEPRFAVQVQDVFDNQDDYSDWDFQVLRYGRQFRVSPEAKVVLGRNANDNATLRELVRAGDTLIEPHSFEGPTALVIGTVTDEVRHDAGRLIMRYSKRMDEHPTLEAACDDARLVFDAPEPFTQADCDARNISQHKLRRSRAISV